MLAGVPTPARAKRLVANIRRFLTGIGAPGGPSRIGSAISPAAADPDVTEPRTATGPLGDAGPLLGASQFPGGVWFDVNGWLTWALSELDGVVPHARRYAWDEYTRNTLEAHTRAFPNHWNGTISSDDVCNGFYSPEPARCGIGGALNVWAGEITEQPTWMVMNAIRLAGVTATRSGYRIAPHLPFKRFSLRTSQIGVTARRRELRGYVTPHLDGPVRVSVALPTGRTVVLKLGGRAGARAHWAVRW